LQRTTLRQTLCKGLVIPFSVFLVLFTASTRAEIEGLYRGALK